MQKHAYVLGANGTDTFGSLQFATSDARRFADTIGGHRYGFKVVHPREPTDPYSIKKELDYLAKSCSETDVFVFFFSGHGELIKGDLFLVLDATVPGDETTYLPVNWVLESRNRCAAKNRLLILDCCHSGAATGLKSARAVDFAELGFDAQNNLLLLASRRLEAAREFEHLKGSFLTVELCQFLNSSGPLVTLSQAMAHLNVSARRYNASTRPTSSLVPIPYLFGDQQGEFIFSGSLDYPDLSRYVTVRDQGPDNSSASVALITAMETSLARQGRGVRLSPRYVREKSRRVGQMGTQEGDGEALAPVIFVAEHFGAPPEEMWPYVAGTRERSADQTWRKLDRAARPFKARCFRLQTSSEIAGFLRRGCCVVARTKIHTGWLHARAETILQSCASNEEIVGVHCITFIGRSANNYLFANSWGSEWGDHGLCRISDIGVRAQVDEENLWAIEVP
jgi:hypothetical protein